MVPYARFTEVERSRRDAAADVAVNCCGWLLAVVFVVGFAKGWWWGGDLRNIPLVGDQWARAAAERRGFPWIPLLAAFLGAYWTRRIWLLMADLARGVAPAARYRRPAKFPPGGGC